MSDQGPNLPPPQNGRNPRLPGAKGGENSMPRWAILLVSAVVITLLVLAVGGGGQAATNEISYNEFLDRLDAGEFSKIEYNNATFEIKATTKDDPPEVLQTFSLREIPEAVQADFRASGAEIVPKTNTGNVFTNTILPLFLPLGFIILFFWWISKRQQNQMGGIMSVGRSKAKTYTTERPGTTFDDVAGYAGVKREITEVVDFLKHPNKFGEIGARIPKGVLLVGPPGTGKTLIARAVAGEAGVPFMSVTGSDFMEMFVGVGASRVRDLFAEARKMGRAIIFIDEIDSIGRKRGGGIGGGHDEREQTLNQMLAEMDGFEATEGIVMMAATNRPDILDPALLRPGRFDRQVVVPLPELDDRKAILEVHTKHKKMSDDVDLAVIARGTPGMSGADLANLVNEAALFAVRNGKAKIYSESFDQARDRVLIGIERESMVRSPEELERTAYHEAGHALCAAALETHDPVHKVTIIPTGMALGVTMTLPEGDRHKLEQQEAEERIIMALGGRNAEKIVFGEVSSGASDDLRQATGMARRMVTEWGMSDAIGPMSLNDNGPVFLGDGATSREYSERTAELIDTETRKILMEMERRCAELLDTKRGALNLIARSLLEHETVSGAECDRLIALAENNPAAASIEPETLESPTSSAGGGEEFSSPSMADKSTDS